MPSGLGSSLLCLMPATAFYTLPGFVLDILGLHFDCRILLDVLLLDLHMLVVALLQLPLHTYVGEGMATYAACGGATCIAGGGTYTWRDGAYTIGGGIRGAVA